MKKKRFLLMLATLGGTTFSIYSEEIANKYLYQNIQDSFSYVESHKTKQDAKELEERMLDRIIKFQAKTANQLKSLSATELNQLNNLYTTIITIHKKVCTHLRKKDMRLINLDDLTLEENNVLQASSESELIPLMLIIDDILPYYKSKKSFHSASCLTPQYIENIAEKAHAIIELKKTIEEKQHTIKLLEQSKKTAPTKDHSIQIEELRRDVTALTNNLHALEKYNTFGDSLWYKTKSWIKNHPYSTAVLAISIAAATINSALHKEKTIQNKSITPKTNPPGEPAGIQENSGDLSGSDMLFLGGLLLMILKALF